MMRKTNRILNSAGSTTASQNGNTARRSITPIGLVAYLSRAFQPSECR